MSISQRLQVASSHRSYSGDMSSRSSASPLPLAWVLLIGVAALGAYFRFVSSRPLGIDTGWRSAVILSPGSSAFTIAALLAEVGTVAGVAACGAIAAALLFAMRRRREAAMMLTALIIGGILSETAKYLVMRPRPIDAVYAFTGSSYPSGHSMGAAALAISLAFAVASIHRTSRGSVTSGTVRWMSIAAASWVVAMMWSRTALGVHWLSDTVAGAALGVASALIAKQLWIPRRPTPTRAVGASAG